MAKTKRTTRDLWKETARTTLTRFRLSRYARWPNWTGPVPEDPFDPYSEMTNHRDVHTMSLKDYYHGPLADIDGVIKVRLARNVDDVEDAVFMILWETAGHLKAFLDSPKQLEPFLRGLELLSEDGSLTTTSPFIALQYDWGFPIGVREIDPDGLEGRITVTIMEIPYLRAQGQDREAWRKILDEGPGSLTSMKEHEFPEGDFEFPRTYNGSEAYTYVVEGPDEIKTDPATGIAEREQHEMATAVCYLFQRWNLGPLMREKEESWFREPGAEDRIAEAVSKALPLVQGWRVERWDVETARCCLELCGLLDEKEVYAGLATCYLRR
ncbi:hypothetical protein V8F20_009424 [Naviculisporaceae sp. PSN 640]